MVVTWLTEVTLPGLVHPVTRLWLQTRKMVQIPAPVVAGGFLDPLELSLLICNAGMMITPVGTEGREEAVPVSPSRRPPSANHLRQRDEVGSQEPGVAQRMPRSFQPLMGSFILFSCLGTCDALTWVWEELSRFQGSPRVQASVGRMCQDQA